MTLNGKTAVVTGAAGTMGLAAVRMFLEEGAQVALVDADALRLDSLVRFLRGSVLAVPCDVSDPHAVRQAQQQVEKALGPVDILLNNAALASSDKAEATDDAEWRRVMATNLDGPFLCTQAVAPVMLRAGGGSVVHIASISGLRASTLRVAYGTSKAALLHLMRQQAAELGTQGIRVNAVAPGPVETAMAQQVHTSEIRAGYHAAIPLGRYGTPHEIAEAVGFLCSDAAAYVNGQVLAVDGGFDATGIGLNDLEARRKATR
jgi:meso-butanediol dehydrogenase/(S,S)-butanediol dehydrogenase/diacetyl reductase